ncbi:hypothetical protein [Clostridium psychrophilum]|nr:hypothetical protein [Clostridium psychrophilum]
MEMWSTTWQQIICCSRRYNNIGQVEKDDIDKVNPVKIYSYKKKC